MNKTHQNPRRRLLYLYELCKTQKICDPTANIDVPYEGEELEQYNLQNQVNSCHVVSSHICPVNYLNFSGRRRWVVPVCNLGSGGPDWS